MTLGQHPTESEHDSNSGTTSSESKAELELAAARLQIGTLEGKLRAALEELARQASTEHERVRLEVELRNMRDSNSWKITAPIRRMSTITRAIRLAFATVRRQAKTQGSYTGALSHYGAALYREGIPGIHARIARLRSGAGFADGPPSDNVYRAWIERYDTVGNLERAEANSSMSTFDQQPLISVVVPTYNSDATFLDAMIQSVRQQIYPNWELCIADDASTDPEPAQVLRKHMAEDARIKVVFRNANGHISEASNSALSIATGKYVALLDHDDILPPQALFMVAKYINLHPDARMFYSDEDKLTVHGKRTMPYFKSDWNPQMFLTQSMFSHLGVFETELVREVGGFRKGF